MSQWIYSLGDKEARLEYSSSLTRQDEDDLLEWLDLVVAILKRRRDRNRPQTPAVSPTPEHDRC